jgi:hypothetical protein
VIRRNLGPSLDIAVDYVAPLLALLGLLFSVVVGMNIRTDQDSASDFKTLYASAYCFRHGVDAYRFHDLQLVYQQSNVLTPPDWYGHAPVYPPFTLALLAPLTLLSMVHAANFVIGLSALLMAGAIGILNRAAWRTFGLSRSWRLTITAVSVASPLLGFGLAVGNVSVAAAAICIGVMLAPSATPVWLSSVSLATALMMKPHIAVWVVIALFLGGDALRRGGRLVAVWASSASVAATTAVALSLSTRHMLLPQIESYFHVLLSESRGGSMDPAARELLPIQAQITSLQSLLGYWWTNSTATMVLSGFICGGTAVVLYLVGRRLNRQDESPESRVLFFACWCGLGMMATYHRSHDGIFLLVLLPWLCMRLKNSTLDPGAWSVLILYSLISFGPTPQFLNSLGAAKFPSLFELLVYREATLATLALEMVLVWSLCHSIRCPAVCSIGSTLRPEKHFLRDRATTGAYE